MPSNTLILLEKSMLAQIFIYAYINNMPRHNLSQKANLTQENNRRGFEYLSSQFKVLADPKRLEILHFLQKGAMTVSEITETIEISQPMTSRHLAALAQAGMLRRNKSGKTVRYEIADPTLSKLCSLFCKQVEKRLTTELSGLFG